jgi:hypothetical protein
VVFQIKLLEKFKHADGVNCCISVPASLVFDDPCLELVVGAVDASLKNVHKNLLLWKGANSDELAGMDANIRME